MDCGSVLSEPYNGSRIFSTERSQSMSVLSPRKEQPRMTHLESLEAKMANIEVSLSSATNTPRRRKGASLGGNNTTSRIPIGADTISLSSNGKPEHRSSLQEREAIIHSLRVQLGLGKLPRSINSPLDEKEIVAAEQELQKLKIDADNKRLTIRNLKTALDSLDITDNIDMRIRQAELEYALGREELQLLSLVEEIRALQCHIDKTLKTDATNNQSTLYFQLKSGQNMSLYAVNANLGRFGVKHKDDNNGIYIDWALEGEGLFRGDRLIECNGKIINCKSKDEFQKMIEISKMIELVVIRKKSPQQNHQISLIQSQEDNQRLQHRISYLEDQVKELQHSTKDMITSSPHNSKTVNENQHQHQHQHQHQQHQHQQHQHQHQHQHHQHQHQHQQNQHQLKKPQTNQRAMRGDHITSINISSSPHHDGDKPQVFQRGNFVATIIGGKAIQTSVNPITPKMNEVTTNNVNAIHSNKSAIKEAASSSEHHINYYPRRSEIQHSQSQQYIGSNSKMYGSTPKISISNESNSQTYLKQKDKNRDHLKENHRTPRLPSDRHNSQPDLLYDDVFKTEKLKQDENKIQTAIESRHRYRKGGNSDTRSAKSLEFEEEAKLSLLNISKRPTPSSLCRKPREVDYTSEPVATPLSNASRSRNSRPIPPKKPLRLSLQRTQSLQTIEANAAATIIDLERKRAVKRTHRGNKTPDLSQCIDSESGLYYTASLGRNN